MDPNFIKILSNIINPVHIMTWWAFQMKCYIWLPACVSHHLQTTPLNLNLTIKSKYFLLKISPIYLYYWNQTKSILNINKSSIIIYLLVSFSAWVLIYQKWTIFSHLLFSPSTVEALYILRIPNRPNSQLNHWLSIINTHNTQAN